MGKFLLIFGLVSMAATFLLSLMLYFQNKRMELAVMCFALAAAIAISGVTATLLVRFNEQRSKAAFLEAELLAQKAEVKASANHLTWFSQPDGTYVHADGTLAGSGTASAPAIPDSAPAMPAVPAAPAAPDASDVPGGAEPAQKAAEEPKPASAPVAQ